MALSDLPELVGFFSYSREDDVDSHGALSALRIRIQGELRAQLGRTASTFRLWQDKESIPSGTLWEMEIKNAISQATFFIPIVTPTVVASPYCRIELEAFLAREAALGRADLIFPLLYIDVPGLEDAARRQNDPVLLLIARRQYVDWRKLRHQDVRTAAVSEAAERFCTHIRNALHKPWVSPQASAPDGAPTAQARTVHAEAAPGPDPGIAAHPDTASVSEPALQHRKPPRRKTAWVVGAALGIAALVIGAVIWSVAGHRATAPETTTGPTTTGPTTATSKPPACDTTDCWVSRICRTYTERDACHYEPVCRAVFTAAIAQGIPIERYRRGGMLQWSQYVNPDHCNLTLGGPNYKVNATNDCTENCLSINYTWTDTIDHPDVNITNWDTR